jgi:biopolymer transport protein ExbB
MMPWFDAGGAWLGQIQSPVAPPLEEVHGLFSIMQKGGLLMWFILAGSMVATAIFFERARHYHRCRIRVGEFLSGILNLLRRRRFIEALERCDEGYGPVVHVVRCAILRRDLPPSELREVVRENAQLELPRLEANLALLSTIGMIMPLLGLLGTVLGMIDAFTQIARFGGATPVGDLASGIWTALLTTAAGLTVAIPTYMAYNFLVSRLNAILFDMERAGIEIIHALGEPQERDVIRMPEQEGRSSARG